MKREDLIAKINFNELYANFIFSYPSKADLAYSICDNKSFLRCYASFVKVRRLLKAGLRRIGWAINVVPKAQIIKNIQTIIESSTKLEEIYNKNNL